MDSSLYVIRNDATATAFRHDSLDDALEALNREIGECDLWVLFELDRVGAARRVAEGRGHIKRLRAPSAQEPAADVATDREAAYEWRRLLDRRAH